jgi:hypothetical protein
VDAVAGVILDGAGRVNPDYVTDIQTGRRLRSRLQARETRNMVTLVLRFTDGGYKDEGKKETTTSQTRHPQFSSCEVRNLRLSLVQ